LELSFRAGDFRGWLSRSAAIQARGGLRAGLDRAQVTALGGRVQPPGGGAGFQLGEINGRLNGEGRVTAIWAGGICALR
jgi:hypothetical protein